MEFSPMTNNANLVEKVAARTARATQWRVFMRTVRHDLTAKNYAILRVLLQP